MLKLRQNRGWMKGQGRSNRREFREKALFRQESLREKVKCSLFVAENLRICRQNEKDVPYLSQRCTVSVAPMFPICRTTLRICRRRVARALEPQQVTRTYNI